MLEEGAASQPLVQPPRRLSATPSQPPSQPLNQPPSQQPPGVLPCQPQQVPVPTVSFPGQNCLCPYRQFFGTKLSVPLRAKLSVSVQTVFWGKTVCALTDTFLGQHCLCPYRHFFGAKLSVPEFPGMLLQSVCNRIFTGGPDPK